MHRHCDYLQYIQDMLRTLFVDFNSYFASVEQHLNPALRGRPVGVVPVVADSSCCIAASIEAKAFGVKTGTGVAEAKRLCPGIAIVLADHAKYVEIHQQAVAAVERIVPVRQVLSIDEMECELTGRWRERERALALARQLKAALLAAEPISYALDIQLNRRISDDWIAEREALETFRRAWAGQIEEGEGHD